MSYEDFGIHGVNPNGHSEQRAVCPECSRRLPYKHGGTHKEQDLSVNVSKETWVCHRCGWTGTLKEKKERKIFFNPIVSKSVPLEDKNMKYFESRGITKQVVERNRITKDKIYMPGVNQNVPVICFNYYLGDDLVNIKYRDLEKHFCQVKDGGKIFYKLNDIEFETECIITEGEFDALSFEVAGFLNAISVPDGAINPNVTQMTTKLSYLDNCAEYFENMEKIYLATDTDSPGIRLREELARRLGKAKCYIINFPDGCKDANEVLMQKGIQVLKDCVTNAEVYPIEGIHYLNDRKAEILDLYTKGFPNGAKTGYARLDEHLTFFDSIVTVIVGIPSHGKSNWLDQLMIKLIIKNGWKFGIFSPENSRVEIHFQRLCEILVGKPFLPNYNDRMSLQEMEQARDLLNKHIFFIQPANEDYKIENIMNAAQYLVLKEGIKSLILDPWNCIEHEYGTDSETEYTKKILNKLTYFTRNYGLHLFIVAHPAKMRKRKDSNKYEIPNLYDISGSAHWYNKAELGLCVYREFSEDMSKTLYTTLFIQKVKHRWMGKVGYVKFNFEHKSQRYYEFNSEAHENNEIEKYIELTEQGYPASYDIDKEPF